MELRAARAAARRRVGTYTAIVTAAGFAWLVAAGPAAARTAARDPAPVLLLAALVLAAELMPLELGRPGTRDSTTMSQPFAFALVLGVGTPAGVVALGLCSAMADLAGGKAARKVLFNSAQLAIALGAAGAVYDLAGGEPGAAVSLPAFAAAALAFFVVNNLLVEAVLVLAGGTPALDRVRQGVGLRAWVSAMLLGMAPVVTVVAQTSLGLVPGPGLTTAAVYLACRGATGPTGSGPGPRPRPTRPGRAAAEQARLVEGEQALIRRLQESDRLKRDLLAHRLPRAEDPAHGDPGHARDPEPPRDRPGAGRAPRVRGHGRAPGHPPQGAHRAAAAGGQVRADQPPSRPSGPWSTRPLWPATPWPRPGSPTRAGAGAGRPRSPARPGQPRGRPPGAGQPARQRGQVRPDLGPVRLEATRYGPLAVLAVEDTGPGVPVPTANASSSASPSSTPGPPAGPAGSGLGLYIARRLAHDQDGELLVTDPTPPATAPASSSACPSPTVSPGTLPWRMPPSAGRLVAGAGTWSRPFAHSGPCRAVSREVED
jgi:hypothetical protein